MAINKREVFYSKDKRGIIKFEDFCIVQTELGAMVEPFLVNGRPEGAATPWNYADEMSRIDKMTEIDDNQRMRILSGNTQYLHGGETSPTG